MNPKVEVSITRTFQADHSLPDIGTAQRHTHSYSIECGYAQEINSDLGCAQPMQQATNQLLDVLSRIEGKYLNDVLPVPPTAEMLACWILAQLPPDCEWVSIRAYEGFMCKVERKHLLPWMEKLRTSRVRLRAGWTRWKLNCEMERKSG